MRRVVLLCRSKTRENYDAQISYFGLISFFCKYLHYFVLGYHEHSFHLYLNCAFLSGQNLIFLCKQKKVTAFQGLSFIFYITISTKPCGRAVSSLLPNDLFCLPETHGSSSITAVETILLFIMHGCISIHQISNSPNFSPLKVHLLKIYLRICMQLYGKWAR